MERGHARAQSDNFSYRHVAYSPPRPYPPLFSSATTAALQSRQQADQFRRFQEDGGHDSYGHDMRRPESRYTDVSPTEQYPSKAALPIAHVAAKPSGEVLNHPYDGAGAHSSWPYDVARRRSLGAPALPDSSFARNNGRTIMPPPSPPHSTLQNGGPPNTSPFVGARDLASQPPSKRQSGMSISSMLGGSDDRKPPSPSRALRPPSPARARASSMREPYYRGFRESSPGRRLTTTTTIDPFTNGFRAAQTRDDPFSSSTQDSTLNGFRSFNVSQSALPGRPSSQPASNTVILNTDDDSRIPMYRSFGTSAAQEDTRFQESGIDRASFRDHHDSYPSQDATSTFDPAQEHLARFRSADTAKPEYQSFEPIDSRPYSFDQRRDVGRMTPPQPSYADYRNGYYDRPLTLEEHQRMEMGRKDSDGYVRRSILNISPELTRRGRDSPLPQAVQGVRERPADRSGDHTGIKSEFGRMFSGLGSGFGRVTPVAGQSASGYARVLSPTAGGYDYDPVRSASTAARASRKHPRKVMDDGEEVYDGRLTPSLSARGGKRAKTAIPAHHHHHHHHHGHHHHHENGDQQAGSYSMIRFPSNPPSQAAQSAHRHHHHHHTTHAHPAVHHHHYHTEHVLPAKKPTTVIVSESVVQAVVGKPRRHLGSMPYLGFIEAPSAKARDHSIDFSSHAKPLPRFEGRENCLFTVRVPGWIMKQTSQDIETGTISRLEEICKNRHVWGSDVYTDDSDVVAAAVHSGWVRGDFGIANEDLQAIDDAEDEIQQQDTSTIVPLKHDSKPERPLPIPSGHDMHVTLLIVPPLQAYNGTHKHHILSRSWKDRALHDGMSFMIHSIEFVVEGNSSRGVQRNAKSRKARITLEDHKRREAALVLLTLPDVVIGGSIVSVGA